MSDTVTFLLWIICRAESRKKTLINVLDMQRQFHDVEKLQTEQVHNLLKGWNTCMHEHCPKRACQENVVASFFPLKIFIYIYIYI